MFPTHALAMMLFQAGDTPNSDQMKWLVIFVGVMAFCSFVQFLVFVGAGIAAMKVYKSISAEMDVLKAKALPIVASVQGVIDDNRPAVKKVTAKVQEIVDDATPKLKTVTGNVAQASDFVVAKLREYEGTIDEANQTLKDVNSKTRAQVSKVDGMVSSALKATSDVGNTIHRGIRTPVVEIAGVVNGVKAAIDVLVGRARGFASGSGAPPARGAVSGGGRYSSAAAQGHRATGPVPVPPAEAPVAPNPSSAVPPSPGAEAVVERFRNSEKIKPIY